jgi:4-diphosphocytidyl-2-C-methyl-D-erythritol kinase
MSRTIVLRPSAKVNLVLRVGTRRSDGFHEVRSVFQSIAIADSLTLTPRPGPFGLMSRSVGVPTDRTNLVWRAAEALWKAIGGVGEPRDVHIRLDKQIPVSAGLGGGSADAAAALVGLNEIWNGRRSRRDLMAIGAGIGSDVPFFFQGGTAVGVGRGEELYPVDDVTRLGIVIIKPSFGVSAADAYRWLDEDRDSGATPPEPSGRNDVDVGWPGGPVTLCNDLQAAVNRRHPMIDEMVTACVRHGAMAAAMSGSGSAVFAVFPEAVVRKAMSQLQRPDWFVLLTRTLSRREAARRMGL